MKFLFSLFVSLLLWVFLPAQINSFPDFQDFESEILCPASCAPQCSLLGNWKNAIHLNLPPADLNWSSNSGPTTSGNTGPERDHTLGNNFGKYVFLESSCANVGSPTKRGELISEWYDLRATNQLILQFWYHMYGNSMGNLYVDVDTSRVGNWVLNITPPFTGNDTIWKQKIVNVDAFTGRDSVRFRIRGITGSSFLSDMAVDDIELYIPQTYDLAAINIFNPPVAACDLGLDTICANFKSFGTIPILPGDTIFVGYRINGGAPVHDWMVVGDTIGFCDSILVKYRTPFLFAAPGSYQIEAWSEMPGDSLRRFNDTTSRVANSIPQVGTIPYFEDFESGPGGWASGGINNTWAHGTIAKTVISQAFSGVNGWTTGGLGTGKYANDENSFVQSPCFDFGAFCNPWLEMKAWWESETGWDGANITYSTDAGQTWQLLGAFGDPNNWYNDNNVNGAPGGLLDGWSGTGTAGSGGWVTVRHDLATMANEPSVIFRINMGSDGVVNEEGFAFDDVRFYNGLALQQDTTICQPDTAFIYAQGITGDSWFWNTGDTTQVLPVTQTGEYSVEMNHAGCITRDTVYVLVLDSLASVSLGPDTTVCGPTYLLDAGYFPGATYLWSTGDTTRVSTVQATGPVSVEVSTGCDTLRDTLQISLSMPPQPALGPDRNGCDSIPLAGGATTANILWSTGATTPSIAANQSGPYWVRYTDSIGCTTSDTVIVTVFNTNPVTLGPDSIFCDGDTVCLVAGPASTNNSYLWSTGANTRIICPVNAGIYAVECLDTNGCFARDTVELMKEFIPTPFFSFSPGAGNALSFTDLSTGNPTQWLWEFGDGITSNQQNPTHTYGNPGSYQVVLTVSNGCGSATDSMSVIIAGLGNQFQQSFRVYPTPAQDRLYIDFSEPIAEGVNWEIWDLAGRKCLNGEFDTQKSARFEISLMDLPAGVFLLRLAGSGLSGNHRIIHSK